MALSNNLPQGRLEVPCSLLFCGASKLIAKLSRLLQLDTANCKMPTGNECETFKIADVDNSCKNKKIRNEVISSAVISVDDITIDTMSPKIWITFGRKM